MKFPFNCKRKPEELYPFRRIYKGEVPILTNSGTDIQAHRKSDFPPPAVSTHHKSIKSLIEDNEPEDPKPKSVRRHSISPGTSKPNKTAHVESSKHVAPEKFPNNLVVTSRYTYWNFIPKNLFEQFRRVVNFYFLVVAFVQTVIDSPVHPITAVSPLCFVICVTAIKQGYEDWLRHKSDQQVNDRTVRRIKDGKLQETKSKDILVGDILKLESDEQVPTDLLILGSSDEFSRCQINTANLDGETNLKLRYCPSGLPNFRNPEDFDNLHVILECEHPNADLYEFNGSLLIPADKLSKMHWSSSVTDAAKSDPSKPDILSELMKGVIRQGMTDFLSIPLSMDNMALRGTRLKNAEFIYGMVVYTGTDTRLARNSEKSESKFSTVETTVNYYLAFFIGMLMCIVAFCCTMYYGYDWNDGYGVPWYIDYHKIPETASKVLNTVASFTILFNYIIPISLYVTIELQKFLGSKFFVWDNDMVDDEGHEPLCNTSDLNEELGLIEYLFSDKTGTLTQNLMKFRHCSVQTVKYELNYKDNQLYQLANEAQKEKQVSVFKNPDMLQFFKTLALCHSVQVVPRKRPSFEMDPKVMAKKLEDLKLLQKAKEKKQKGKVSGLSENRRISVTTPQPAMSSTPPLLEGMEYQASSPDEKALLESCESLGIVYLGDNDDWMSLNVNGVDEKYKRLMTLEFDADRKCMSVIIQNSKNEIWLLTKGAESSVIPKCDDGPKNETLKHVMDYALLGLRTLAVAVRKLSQVQFDEFDSQLRTARRLLKNRQEKVREVFMEIENHMTLIGATGVEDQLQENVRETLQSFAAAGIRVWMLTGDKLETGVNVALSCGLMTASTKQYIISNTSDPEEIKRRLTEFKGEMDATDNTCFVIDGESLSWAFRECADLLRDVSMAASRVVCCRMAPLQKAQVVNMVKHSKTKPICCAVGDGANDCAMILASHIGIGILGKEGRQAARCADFALAKFGHLRKAILVHGHWYYVRLANLANYFFYKNVVFVLPQLFFSFHSNFSTQPLFNGLFLMNYNIFYSSCPIFYYGLTEQPYPADVLLTHPQLYKNNARNSLMTAKNFSPWVLSATWHAIVVYYIPYLAWDNFDHINDVLSFGTVVFSGLIVVTNMKMFIETKYISFWYVGSQCYSYVTYLVFTSFCSEIPLALFNPEEFRFVFGQVLSSLCFWLLIPLVGSVGILPDLTISVMKRSWKKIVRHFSSFGQISDGSIGSWYYQT